MKFRWIAREFMDFPATVFFCILWIVVFVAMIGSQYADGVRVPWLNLWFTGVNAGHRFGDLALEDINRGEVWRLITSTFLQYSVLHISVNLLAFYQLGTLLESWYGTHQFVMIYGLTGGVGNLISILIRYRNGSSHLVHSAGGSVVIMGLVALCAVAGLRSRTRMGKWLGWQMVLCMVVTAALGFALPRYLDNWGHLGGALVGFGLGLGHRRFLRLASRPSAWGPAVAVGFVMVACGVAQWVDDSLEATARREQVVVRLASLGRTFQEHTRADGRFRDPRMLLRRLDELGIETILDSQTRPDLVVLRGLAGSGAEPVHEAEIALDFERRLNRLFTRVRRGYLIERSRLFMERREARRRRLSRRRALSFERINAEGGSGEDEVLMILHPFRRLAHS